ncbi:hypothetical protein CHS0354_006255 [Potamilus streckersoni]|uniref:EF-hand domain-containing protein n=1 Tax=Potamilus streckersoni TaxID=2493646 RepID=A0AAE0RMM1_9BIVA|nr:hypothetical protein CHS0354_006255 [Potamilus streckersoni]
MNTVWSLTVCIVCCGLVMSFPTVIKSRHKRGFRATVADRIAHGFGKRTQTVYNSDDFSSLRSNGYGLTDSRIVGLPVVDMADQLLRDRYSLVTFLENMIDRNGDGIITEEEFFRDDYVSRI